MSTQKGYVKYIGPSSTDSHQTSPGYMLTFLRWDNRDTFNYTTKKDKSKNGKTVRKPLIVYNDAVSITASDQKSSATPSLNAVLLGGDINYSTAVHPGDFVLLNMVNWNKDVSVTDDEGNEINGSSLRARAGHLKALNNYDDGFKGLYKVQSVTRELRTDPSTGIKIVVYQVKAFGFTEFNSMVYYDPQVFGALEGNLRLFQNKIDAFWSTVVKDKQPFPIQNLIQILISAFLGQNFEKTNIKLPSPQITYFEAPQGLGNLLGLSNAKFVCDIYNYALGIWPESSNSKAPGPKEGFNPGFTRSEKLPAGFYQTPDGLDGSKMIDAEYWNNVKIWSIIQKYANLSVNEMYTTTRVNVNGRVMPTLVIRQKPFTSLHFTPKSKATKFMNLPRWKISPDLMFDYSLGKDEAARVNYVQIYTRSLAANDSRNRAKQTAEGNFVVDIEDIQRNGLKTYLSTANYDYVNSGGNKPTKAKEWTELISDWVINGNLRESGSITCVGIQDPIAVGDNLEFDGSIYHIEGVTHSMEINRASGSKTFRTTLSVSFGTDMRSDSSRPVYPQMEHTDAFTERLRDYGRVGGKGEELGSQGRLLPGFSDTQEIAGRGPLGEETKETSEKSFTLDPKPRDSSHDAVSIQELEDSKNSSNKTPDTKPIDSKE